MRRIISFLLIFTALAANARQITPEEAQSIASEFFNSCSTSKVEKAPRRAVQASRSAENQSEPKPYYIFNADDNAGFVIISGDTRVKKILGYSDNGCFDTSNMPPQLKAMLEQYTKAIDTLPATQSQDPSWQSDAANSASDDGILLETANWGQGYPYNCKTPVIDGSHCPAGCVATAASIIMKYHNWPIKGRGSHMNTFTKESVDLNDFSIDWSILKNNSNELNEDSEAVDLIGTVMRMVGETSNLTYDLNETSGYISYVYPALFTHFKYKMPRYYTKCDSYGYFTYTDEEWHNLLKDELSNKRPVLYASLLDENAPKTGHAYVIDGMDSNGMYHVNWGWDGESDGFFKLWIEDTDPSLWASHQMITQIEPDFSSTDWKNRSRMGQRAGGRWDTFDDAKLMNFSQTFAF